MKELGFHDHGASQVSLVSLAHYFYSSISSRLKLTNIFIFFLGEHYIRLPVLTNIEIKRSEKVFKRIGCGGYFEVPKVLDSQTFHRFFAPSCVEMSFSGEDKSRDDAASSSGDVGEFLPF